MSPEAKRQLNFLASMPAGHTTMERTEVREILLETGGNMLSCGRLYDIVAKEIGAGVYRVSLSRLRIRETGSAVTTYKYRGKR